MDKPLLDRIFLLCRSGDVDIALNALDDLGWLVERHTTDRYGEPEYGLFFYEKQLVNQTLDEQDMCHITCFLFYLLLNYPDRSPRTAWCLS